MSSSRFALVAMLVAVEVFLLGLMLAALRGGMWPGVHAGGARRMDVSAKTYAPLAAGSAPHVQIDDPDSAVVVSASTDGLVHVVDNSAMHGIFFGTAKFASLTIARTFDGVRIARPGNKGSGVVMFGEISQRIAVQVPSDAHVDIARSSSAEVSGMRNAVDAISQDGHIAVADIRGDVRVHSDDGHIDASDLSGSTIAISTNDGHVSLRDVQAQSLDVKTSDGRIEAFGLAIAGASPHVTLHSDDGSLHISGQFARAGSYDFSTGDGRVELALAPASDLTVDATTHGGRIDVDGSSFGDGDSAATHTVRLGDGSGAMRLTTQDGSIRIRTNGAI